MKVQNNYLYFLPNHLTSSKNKQSHSSTPSCPFSLFFFSQASFALCFNSDTGITLRACHCKSGFSQRSIPYSNDCSLAKNSLILFSLKKIIRKKVCNTYTSTTDWSGNYSFYAIKCPRRLFKTWPGRPSICLKPAFNWVLVITGVQFSEFFQADLLLSTVSLPCPDKLSLGLRE